MKILLTLAILSISIFAQAQLDNDFTSAQTAVQTLYNDATDRVNQLQTELVDAEAQIVTLQGQVNSNDVKVFDRLEFNPWRMNSLGVQVGGCEVALAGSFTNPSAASASLAITPTCSYSDTYFVQSLGGDNTRTRFVYDLSFLFPDLNSVNASQAIEWEARQDAAGFTYNSAFQCEFKTGLLRTYDGVAHAWIATAVPCSGVLGQARFTPGKWYRFIVFSHHDSNTITFDSVTLNGVNYPLNIVRQVAATTWTDNIKAAIQLDGNVNKIAYRVYVSNLSLKAFLQ